MAYLCFCLDSIPDLSLSKYSSLDESGVDGVLKKTSSFLRQINRKGILSKVFFHLLYTYVPEAANGQRLKVRFVVSGKEDMLLHTRELIQNSAISAFYDIVSVERVLITKVDHDQQGLHSVTLQNHLGHISRYNSTQIKNPRILSDTANSQGKYYTARISRGVLSLDDDGIIDESGLMKNENAYDFVAALGKREFFVQPSVILPDDNDMKYYKVAECVFVNKNSHEPPLATVNETVGRWQYFE